MPTRLLVLDAPGSAMESLLHLFAAAGHETSLVADVAEVLERLAQGGADVVLAAIDVAGLQGLSLIAGRLEGAELVVLASSVDAPEVRDALRLGAFDVVRRADSADSVLHAVERAASVGRLWREVATLRARVGERVTTALVGRSTSMEQVRELIGRAAASRLPVLVTGEAGTGKDLVARLVHDLSDRADRPFVTVRCQDAHAATLEAELFGGTAESGIPMRGGLFEQARGGTLVLDGYAELPPSLRARVATVLADRAIERITRHGREAVPVDVRLILAARETDGQTSSVLHDDDVLRRFNLLPIALPPLRERRRDIPLLIEHFRARHASSDGTAAISPMKDMLSLIAREWPGNVRELEHFVERAAYLPITPDTAPTATGIGDMLDEGLTLEDVERRYVLRVLDDVDGNQSRAAERLGIDRRTLYRKLKQYRADGSTGRIAS